MKPPLSRLYKVNATDQMFGTKENGAPDPLRYDGHVDAPQKVKRMLAELVPVGSRALHVGWEDARCQQAWSDNVACQPQHEGYHCSPFMRSRSMLCNKSLGGIGQSLEYGRLLQLYFLEN